MTMLRIAILVFIHLRVVFGSQDLNKECGSEEEYKDCQFKNDPGTSSIKCRYKKSYDFTTDTVSLLESPGPAKDLNISLMERTNHMLITWNLPHDSSVSKLEGFLVNVTFRLDGVDFELLRTFKIDILNLENEEAIFHAAIKYPCIGVFPKTLYRVQVISYPRSAIPSVKETEVFIPNLDFNVTAEATLSGNWKARMWSTIQEVEGLYSFTVCFYGAPKKFNMLHYFLRLRVDFQESNVDELTVSIENVTAADGKEICRTFGTHVNGSRDYYIYLLPRGPDDCVCEFMHGTRPTCYDACSMNYIGPIVLPGIGGIGGIGAADITDVTDEIPRLETDLTVLIVCLCVVIVTTLAAICTYLFYRFAVKKIKEYISTVQKGKLLIVIVDDMENISTLQNHLEKSLMTWSYVDLTKEIDPTESTVNLLSDKILIRHNRYLVVHRAGVKCPDLGDSGVPNDTKLAKTVQKFKGKAVNESMCMHPFQLNSGSDPKAILKIIYELIDDGGIFQPPDGLSEEHELKTLRRHLKCISTLSVDSQSLFCEEKQRYDSGIGEEIRDQSTSSLASHDRDDSSCLCQYTP